MTNYTALYISRKKADLRNMDAQQDCIRKQ